jgi:CubicO group peptidase (beta-lactamase class C family)
MPLLPRRRRLSLLLLPLALASCALSQSVAAPRSAALPAACAVPGVNWSPATPAEESHWSQEKLAAAKQYADSIHSDSVMIIQHGKVIDQWGDVDKKLTTFSARKSLISALYGIYSAKGKINIDATLAQLGISDSPDPLTPAEQQARVVDLLRARSGVYHPSDFETDSMKKNRPLRGSHAPGTFWYYNNWDFSTLGTIFEKETGLSIGNAFELSIAKPLGMQDFVPSDVYYLPGPISSNRGWMFEMTARDLARFGQMYLCDGRWGGKQIVPADWIYKSSHTNEMVYGSNKKAISGYEYLWWVEYQGHLMGPATLPGMFSAIGAGGHYILVIPSLDMVIVHRFNNEPTHHDVQSLIEATRNPGVWDDEFHKLLQLILEAQVNPLPMGKQ